MKAAFVSSAGGQAGYLITDSRCAMTVPGDVDPAEAASRPGAGVTTYQVVKVGGVTPGDRVAVFGLGGLGPLALRYAQLFGGETVVVDVTAEKLALARELGADHVVDAATTDPVAAIEALGGADVAVVLTDDPKVLQQAHASLRRGGRLILVSLPEDNTMSWPIFQTAMKGIPEAGTIVGPGADLAEVFRSHTAGHSRVPARPLSLIGSP